MVKQVLTQGITWNPGLPWVTFAYLVRRTVGACIRQKLVRLLLVYWGGLSFLNKEGPCLVQVSSRRMVCPG